MLKSSNEQLSKAKKGVDAAKAKLAAWLKTKRGLEISTLGIGAKVNIEGVAMLTIGKRNAFDQEALMLANPTLYAQYKRDFAVTYYEALV